MKRSLIPVIPFILAASLVLAACSSGTPLPSAPVSPSPAKPSPSSTSSTKSPSASLTPTSTPAPCDPRQAETCIIVAPFPFQLPIAAPGNDRIDRNYTYGSTEGGTREPHHGVEFENPSGTPVRAAAGGTVYYAGDDSTRLFSPWVDFYGNLVVLEHRLTGEPFAKLYTLYAHLSKIDVSRGQAMQAGETLGEVGLSGMAVGSHLHFEVRIIPEDYYSTLNPELWLQPHTGNGSLLIQAADSSGENIAPTFNLQYFPDRTKPAAANFEVDAYAGETVNLLDTWDEVAATGDQPAGWYRITFYWKGTFYERWVDVRPGLLTQTSFSVN
jgi:murein DD-endopeptidase MepM/ murein hydrolase activator NlpD